MSNSIVPTVYCQIMKDVLRSVQNDFEENGIGLSVLIELEKLWETRVFNSNVANFEILSHEYIQATTAPLIVPGPSKKPSGSKKGANQTELYNKYDLPAQPPFYDKSLPPNPNMYSAANLASIATLQRLNASNGYIPITILPNTSLTTLQSNGLFNNNGVFMQQNYASIPVQSIYNLSSANAPSNLVDPKSIVYNTTPNQPGAFPPSLGPSQLDGTSEEFPSTTLTLTGQKDRKVNFVSYNSMVPQLDGEDSTPTKLTYEEASEDAINSDLDDSADEEFKENGDEDVEHILLCQYDKVARTKNRWRVNLKDGIILISGKEYVFNKSSGEFRW